MGKLGSGAHNSSCACFLWFYLQFSFVYLSAQLPPKKKEVVREKDKMFKKNVFSFGKSWFLQHRDFYSACASTYLLISFATNTVELLSYEERLIV